MSVPDPVTIAVTGGLVLSGANQAAKQAQDFLAAATGHPRESIGTILGNMMQRRINNAESILSRSHLTLLNIGLTPREIPLNVLQPALEAASLQEDEYLRETWSNLLANAADPRKSVPPSFPKMLSEMSPKEARFLNTLYEHLSASASKYGEDQARLWYTSPLDRGQLLNVYITDEPVVQFFNVDLDSLLRFRIIESEPRPLDRDSFLAGEPTNQEDNPVYRMTDLGYSFVMACRPPVKS
jgi:hypothetical protein